MDRLRRAKRDFAVIPNEAMRDTRLSAEARGLLAYLMTHADEWEFRFPVVQKAMCCGKDRLQRMIRELIEIGYLERQPRRDDTGAWAGQDWIIHEEPTGATECLKTRVPENPAVGKPRTHIEDQGSKKTKKKEEQGAFRASPSSKHDPNGNAQSEASRLAAEFVANAEKKLEAEKPSHRHRQEALFASELTRVN